MKIIKEKGNLKPISEHYLEDYLLELGVDAEHIDSFLYAPRDADMDDPYKLNNMEAGLSMLKAAIEAKEKFYLQVDCDVDGYTSASIFYNYFKSKYPDMDIQWDLHTGKEHGVELSHIKEDRTFVVIPDAGSMQLNEQKELAQRGVKVLILDHHEMTKKENIPNVVIINNQDSPAFENKELSGAGVVLLFVKAYDTKNFQSEDWKWYLDLAALGIIADMMDSRTIGNNFIIQKGLAAIHNKMFQALLQKQAYKIPNLSHPSKLDVAFYIAPLMNGLIRVGRQEEKELFFRAMTTAQSDELIETGRGGTETLYESAARLAANAKSRQDHAKKKAFTLLNEKIHVMGLDKHKILAVVLAGKDLEEVPSTLTGLAAMELLKSYNRPTMVLRENVHLEDGSVDYNGSLRSKNFMNFASFLDYINKSGYGSSQGHPNAAGVSFKGDKLKAFIQYSDAALKDIDFNQDCVEVEYWFKNTINQKMLTEFAKGTYVYGNGIPEPHFAFTLSIPTQDISFIGAAHDTIKFNFGGVSFIMFKQPKLARELNQTTRNSITCIGKPTINSFNNSLQIIVDDLDYTPEKVTNLEDLL